jgi:hypothetical protein
MITAAAWEVWAGEWDSKQKRALRGLFCYSESI